MAELEELAAQGEYVSADHSRTCLRPALPPHDCGLKLIPQSLLCSMLCVIHFEKNAGTSQKP